MSKVIILRGNSGSGKSTVAGELVRLVSNPTVIIEQDIFREHMFFPRGEYRLGTRDFSEESKELMTINVSYALDHGFDVIWVGVFSAQKYKEYFDKFFDVYDVDELYVYTFDIDFDETVTRHATRRKADDFGIEDMRRWYRDVELLGYPNEVTITRAYSIDQTIALIREHSSI